MADELIGNLLVTIRHKASKNSSNAFSLGIASCIWARFTQKNSLPNLVKKKWKTFLIIRKPSYQARW